MAATARLLLHQKDGPTFESRCRGIKLPWTAMTLSRGGTRGPPWWREQHSSPLDRKVDPLPLPPRAAPYQHDPMLQGHMERVRSRTAHLPGISHK